MAIDVRHKHDHTTPLYILSSTTPMRFFKSLSLLHRRSKSDPALTSRPSATNSAILLIGPSHEGFPIDIIDITADHGPRNRPLTCPNQRVFEVELEIQQLSHTNASLALRLTLAENQLRLTMSELYAEMHKSIHLLRQAKKDKDTIDELQKTCQQLRRTLSSFPDAASTFNLPTDPRSIDSHMETDSPHTGSSILRQSDENHYSTALQLVLKTRQELRNCKKTALFWKRKAKTIPEHANLVTPSPSEISEVQDVLTRERMEAVNALQRRRQLMSASGTQATLASVNFLKLAPKLVPPVPRTGTDERQTQSYQSSDSLYGKQDLVVEVDGHDGWERVSSVAGENNQSKLRKKVSSIDLRMSASFASA
ncbi:hypothetical protein D9756_001775 [Leucocoprinus leucothites]|uniref:Uncharacterized protein n=1 Tax=Leucocoprinus leucothites TaxID=201217 RepID=A0A8H5G569_9AGAR|nr:hypothetical protein D9756_001775 [Leucoagaricus leucothites]